MPRQLCISDIHGCLKTFDALLDRVGFSRSDELFLLGDYVDRGPDSKGVIDRIWQLELDGYAITALMGNHETIVLDDLEIEKSDPRERRGDEAFLASFGAQKTSDVPPEYFEWMSSRPIFWETGNWILVHAGLNFRAADPLEPTPDNIAEMLWIRDWHSQIDRNWLQNRIIVHGHTPMRHWIIEKNFERMAEAGFIDIDVGCFAKHIKGLGHLCCLDLTSREIFFEPNCD